MRSGFESGLEVYKSFESLWQMTSNVNNPHVHQNSLSLISSDSFISENSKTNMDGEDVTGYMLGISYICTALRYKLAFIAIWWTG